MSSIHTVPLHLGDLLTDTMHLTPAELGAYIRLLAFHYRMGRTGIADDDAQLRRITGLDNKSWSKSRGTILSFFELDGDRRWVHGKVQKVIDGILDVREQNRVKALKRWNSPDATALPDECSGTAEAMQSINHKPVIHKPVKKEKGSTPRVMLAELSVDHVADWLAEKRSTGKYLSHDPHFILDQFRNYCQAKGKTYADYVAGYRNAFEWERCQPKPAASANRQPTKDDRARAAVMRAAVAGGFAPTP